MSVAYDDSVGVEVSSDSFWEVGNYKRTVKRIDDGHRLCSDLMNCLHERARIEKTYAQQLTEWARRWRQLVDKGPQYGTVEKAWIAVMAEAERVSELHLEVRASLMNEDVEKIKNWQKESFHKQMMGGFKETKEAEDGFRKAQKPWAKKLKEVDAAKKAYHAACKEEKLAISRESNSKADPSLNPEQLKKLQDKVERCKQDVLRTKEKYEKSLKELDQGTPQYMENMEQVFEQCQQFEEKRLRFFREVLLEVQKHLDLSAVASYKNIYQDLEQKIKAADAVEDLRWFRANHGPGMSMNWPQFEEWSADLNRTLSRREKKKAADGVTLTGINQTGDQSLQNKHSSNLSVPSNPAQSAQSQSSYNPFEDEDDTGSTVSEKEDIKAKKLVNERSPSSLPLSVQGSQGLAPRHESMHEALQEGTARLARLWLLHPLGEGHPLTLFSCFFSALHLTLIKALAPPSQKTAPDGRHVGGISASSPPCAGWLMNVDMA
ncbi:protein kinase C and casein kinase substrate in neurons protein 2 isoform X1 [Elephas maximus indicus]|uniref:protein kinase C and casein kinase substrate in neurons protein 2 isoform X1 n=1 Tax=Elephas maximus indicus TaxID=99487 RepID=UPI002115D64E|nr:protein kinase C and casein kinase substrate in neurons protein 2 isoform X1 [Elephas maximus indicus]XP_049740525.1 protein kinase C and casein kinase substrate in neurons protein 2 isoform X1 [Elephas maximus indicus]XP_049740526.1 protein kinase C and casein kinase substrate in neurons protein 2 isoform X1 [Elephas maximus indicus]XP_049740527.1 protein kinase C and casein kinase substrate in neurons protein 2 isoform X1 [Elephas maximus indicus]XP_049740528.1 protein kinase C and casein 